MFDQDELTKNGGILNDKLKRDEEAETEEDIESNTTATSWRPGTKKVSDSELMTVSNVTVTVLLKHNMQLTHEFKAKVNITLIDCPSVFDKDSSVGCGDQGHAVGVDIQNANLNDLSFPTKIMMRMEQKKLEYYMENIADYSFFVTMIVMGSFFVMLGQIKLISQDYQLAKSLSLVSIAANLIWNFFFFTLHFQLSIKG